MSFQFLCPQGHLLEGDEAHMGMMTQCPHCGMTFIIPRVEVPPPEPEPEPQPFDVYSQPYVPDPEPEAFVPPEPEPPSGSMLDDLPPPADDVGHTISHEPPPAHILHIPCPNGHVLDTPYEMIGGEVLCPYCGAQFLLRREDSSEYQAEMELIEQRRARIWFNWAIAAAIAVFVGLITMLVYVARE